MLKLQNFYNKRKTKVITISILLFIVLLIMPFVTARRVNIDSSYTSKEDVAFYIMTYHELPPNYITYYGKEYAKNHGVELSSYTMGGDTHFNTNELRRFSASNKAKLKECDIEGFSYNILGNRGSRRLVYTCNQKNVRVFYTEDHYKTFVELTSFSLNIVRNIFWIIFGVYATVFVVFYILVSRENKRQTSAANSQCTDDPTA